MVKHKQNLMEQVIFDCFSGLNKLEQSMPERICHYILYGKDDMILDDLNVLPKTNKYDKGYYILLGVFFLIKAINHSKNRHASLPVYIISKSSADYIAIANVSSKFDSD